MNVKQCRDALVAGAAPRTRRPRRVRLASRAARAKASSTLAVVATSLDDLKEKLDVALESISEIGRDRHATRGVSTSPRSLHSRTAQVAFLFPGQGRSTRTCSPSSAMAFPEVREVLDRAEQTLTGDLDSRSAS